MAEKKLKFERVIDCWDAMPREGLVFAIVPLRRRFSVLVSNELPFVERALTKRLKDAKAACQAEYERITSQEANKDQP